MKDSGGSYTGECTLAKILYLLQLQRHTRPTSCPYVFSLASQEDAVHVVTDRHLITGQNMRSTSLAVHNLILLSSGKDK